MIFSSPTFTRRNRFARNRGERRDTRIMRIRLGFSKGHARRRGIGRSEATIGWGRGEKGDGERPGCVYAKYENWFLARLPPHIYYMRSYTVNVCPRRHLHACASRQGLGSNARLEMPLDPATGSRTQCLEDNIAEINYTPSHRERKRDHAEKKSSRTHECHVTREKIMHYITSICMCPIIADLYHYFDQLAGQMHVFSPLRNKKV